MTCIAAKIDTDGTIIMGADSCASTSYIEKRRAEPKVFRKGDMLIGYCGSARMGQLLRYRLQVPEREWRSTVMDSTACTTVPTIADHEYMATAFVDAVRDCLRDHAFASVDKNVERGGTFLVGYRGLLYTIFSDYQVGWDDYPYMSIGSGQEVALGSLHTTHKVHMAAGMAVEYALEAAAEFSVGVRAPFIYERLQA